MSGKKWLLPQSFLNKINNPSQRAYEYNWSGIVEKIQIATLDGLAPTTSEPSNGFSVPSSNIDPVESYIQISGTKYYFDGPLISTFDPSTIYLDGNKLVIQSDISNYIYGIYNGEVIRLYGQSYQLRLGIDIANTNRQVYVDVDYPGPNNSYTYPIIFEDGISYEPNGSGSGGGSGGGGGSSTTPVSGAVVVGGKAVGTVSVDPRTTPIRVTIDGVEQALPTGSVVKNTVTGQKFLKLAGGELEFAAVEVVPLAEWSWDAAGAEAWAVLQGF